MQHALRKMSFLSVFALVTGSQIGSGVFMLPANLAPFGVYGLVGWIISGIGAVALALVFAQLCAWFPQTGGPHVYVQQAFGKSMAFFTGWTYWIISWISTTVVITASVGYLTPLIGINSVVVNVGLEIALVIMIMLLNFRGVTVAGSIEFVLTLLKFIPLLMIPGAALFYFDMHNFNIDASVAHFSLSQLISRATLLTLWGFIGLESATTPAESVESPSKTIPRAIVLGTLSVALLYLINSIAIMGIIPASDLMTSNAPYADASRMIFGGNWHLIISLIAAVICIGTLNAWTLTSGQIALGLAQDGLMPALFGYKNRFGAPYWGLIISCLGTVPLLLMTAHEHLAAQVVMIIDFSVTAFLFVYALCCLAFFKLLWQKSATTGAMLWHNVYGIIALGFCVWVIYETPLHVIAIASLFSLSGLPCYFYCLGKKN